MDRTSAVIVGSGIALAGGFIAVAIYLVRRKGSAAPPASIPEEAKKKTESPITAVGVPAITNEESWTWRDYAGRERKITVHRKVNYG